MTHSDFNSACNSRILNPAFPLFEGRHDIKLASLGEPIFKEFDFSTSKAIYNNSMREKLEEAMYNQGHVHVVVTGLTPALLQFIQDLHWGTFILWHYDREKDSYWGQIISKEYETLEEFIEWYNEEIPQ
jgi:hypothetical protein